VTEKNTVFVSIVIDGESFRPARAAAPGVGPIPWPASLRAAQSSQGALSYTVTVTQHDSGKLEGENQRQGSADEPFNWEISVKRLLSSLLAISLSLFSIPLLAEPVAINVDHANPPFMYEGNQAADGLYPDLLRAIFKRMNQAVVIRALPWKRVLGDIDAGKAGVGGIYKTPERLKKYDYTEVLYDERLVLYVQKDKPFVFSSLEDLKGKNLGVIRGWSYGAQFDKTREEGLFKVDDNVSDSANFRKLVIGRLDGVIAIEAAADMVIAKEGFGKALVALDKPLAVNSTYLAFAKKANKLELIKKFNQAMQEMKADGSFQAAVNEFVE
jgi:polar amino acid transport system substrate-binding protein